MQLNSNIITKTVSYADLGRIQYAKAWSLQEDLFNETVQRKISNRNLSEADQQPTSHHLLLCEHNPVVTLGKNADLKNLLIPEQGTDNVEVFHTNRGGDVTFHGPGQLVGYPILDLDEYYTDISRYLRNLEETIIRTIAEYGIIGDRLPGATGVWLDPNDPLRARKICAMGIRCSRWVTMHGFAFNVNCDLSYFGNIIPCGIVDKSVTSMQKELNREVDMQEVQQKLKGHLKNLFDFHFVNE